MLVLHILETQQMNWFANVTFSLLVLELGAVRGQLSLVDRMLHVGLMFSRHIHHIQCQNYFSIQQEEQGICQKPSKISHLIKTCRVSSFFLYDQGRKHTVAWDLAEGDIEINIHLLFPATIDNQRRLDMNSPVVEQLSKEQDQDNHRARHRHFIHARRMRKKEKIVEYV